MEYPNPKTLIVNGDLTAYFHRNEFEKYKSYYHDITGLEEYFPGLGNHDYDHQDGASFNSDQWLGPHRCNAMHSIKYFKDAFCPSNDDGTTGVPNFDARGKITRYDSKSLAYSWEMPPYHFVHLHYFPTYENAKVGISNSLEWLGEDLRLAGAMNLTSILFVHAANRLSFAVEEMLLLETNRVAAIFTGHLHRCFGKKCLLS
jgi:cytolysin (calcineurin-like family phosphatase)